MHVAPPQYEVPSHIFQQSSQNSSRHSSRTNFSESSDDDYTSHRPSSRSSHGRSASRPSSRPTSRASRKRNGSVSAVGDKEKQKEKPRRKSVSGWASSAVDSVTGRGRKNKDKFATLADDDKQDSTEDPTEADAATLKKSTSSSSISTKRFKDKSRENLATISPKPPARILKPPSLQEKKMVRARYSFSGATDELSFMAGDEITVVNEVLDGWWMGELSGKRGLFPTTHVEVLLPGSRRVMNFRGSDLDSSSGSTNWTVVDKFEPDPSDDDRDMGSKSLTSDRSPSYHGLHPSDTMSITSSVAEDDDNKRLMPIRHSSDDYAIDEHYFQSHSSTTPPGFIDRSIFHSLSSSSRPIRLPDAEPTPGKKAPPPPPPRRPTITPIATPPIPERPYRPYRHTPSHSANSLKAAPAGNRSGHDRSPFESATELSTNR